MVGKCAELDYSLFNVTHWHRQMASSRLDLSLF
jgi:hypothetical protein